MDLLELLRQRGKALVLQGPQGCGKGLLARQLAGPSCSEVHIDNLLTEDPWFRGWLKDQVKTVIVEGVPKTPEDIGAVKTLIVNLKTVYEQKGKAPKVVDVPSFIFCTSDPEPLDFGPNDRRFYVIKMDSVI